MWSRRHFLRHCTATSAGLLWAMRVGAADKPEPTKPDQLLTPAVEKAIESGLKYLNDQQHKDGSFGTAAYRGNIGITSLCGLAMLSGSDRPGPFATTIDAAVDFVLSKEDPAQPGYLHNKDASPHGPMYNHGYATLFLATAHSAIRDAKRAEKL